MPSDTVSKIYPDGTIKIMHSRGSPTRKWPLEGKIRIPPTGASRNFRVGAKGSRGSPAGAGNDRAALRCFQHHECPSRILNEIGHEQSEARAGGRSRRERISDCKETAATRLGLIQ